MKKAQHVITVSSGDVKLPIYYTPVKIRMKPKEDATDGERTPDVAFKIMTPTQSRIAIMEGAGTSGHPR